MNSKWNEVGRMLNHYRYLIVVVVGVLIVGFVDDNSFMHRLEYDPKAIEKIARERYFMKADDEDIYVLSDDEKPTQQQDETTE